MIKWIASNAVKLASVTVILAVAKTIIKDAVRDGVIEASQK